jgi:hypothetical protein
LPFADRGDLAAMPAPQKADLLIGRMYVNLPAKEQ